MSNQSSNLPPVEVTRRSSARSPSTERQTAPRQKTTIPRSSGAQKRDSLFELILDLRAIVTTTDEREEVVQRLTETLVKRTRLLAAAWVQVDSGEQPSVLHATFSNPTFDSQVMRKILLDAALSTAGENAPRMVWPDKIRGTAVVCVPFYQDSQTTGVLCGLVHDEQSTSYESILTCQLVANHYDLWRSRDQITLLNFEIRSAATVLELIGTSQNSESLQESALKIANELQNLFRCDYVAVGYRKDKSSDARLLALSSTADFDHQSRTTMALKNAFDETLLRGTITRFPDQKKDLATRALAHRKLAQHLRCESVVSMPLRNQQDELIGVITIMGGRDLARSTRTSNLARALEHPVGSSLQVVRKIEGGWLTRLSRRIFAQEKVSTKWAVVAVVLIATISMFMPVPYRIHCDCTAEPVNRSFSVAPYEGLLENTFVEPGDVVQRDQILARMDGREIRFKIAGLVAERDRAARKRDIHRANNEISDAIRADLERKRFETELEVMQHREQNLEVRSSIAGIVLSGSLDRRQNYPVKVGQTLYEIAPIDPIRVELSIDAEEIMHLSKDQTVYLRFDGFGTETLAGRISRIRPSSTIRDEQNVFVAEVILTNTDKEIRPGMDGKARVIGPRHTLGWTLFHRPWEKFVTAIGF